MDMANIMKYKSKISRKAHEINGPKMGRKGGHARAKHMLRRAMRRCLKVADDESGCLVSGTNWS